MRILLSFAVAAVFVAAPAFSDEPAKKAPNIVLKSPDGKKTYDLAKLVEKGPVLLRLTCACSGCDAEVGYFQKLQEAYNAKGLQTLAVFKEAPEAAETYTVKKKINFMWLSDPKGDLWKTFDAKAMPTNILIDKGGRIVRIIPGCTTDGKNAQTLSTEIANLLQVSPVQIVTPKEKQK